MNATKQTRKVGTGGLGTHITNTEPDWEGAYAYIRIRQNHIALFSDGWAISYMGSRRVWRRGFQSIAGAKRSLTAAYKRLSTL